MTSNNKFNVMRMRASIVAIGGKLKIFNNLFILRPSDVNMAEAERVGVGIASSKESVASSSSKSKLTDSKDAISIKVICLGDSAVGKSK